MAPGPARIGMASGKTLTSWLASASIPSSGVSRVRDGRAKSMSIAMRSRRTPPAIENAGTVIPSACRKNRPANANRTRMTAAISTALRIVLSRSLRSISGVSARKRGAIPTGSTTLTMVATAAAKNDISLEQLHLQVVNNRAGLQSSRQARVASLPVIGVDRDGQRFLRAHQDAELPGPRNGSVQKVSLEQHEVPRDERHH